MVIDLVSYYTFCIFDEQTSISRDNVMKPAWCAGNSERGGQSLESTDHLEVGVRPRSSSYSQGQKHPAKLGAAFTGDRSFTIHRREGLQLSSYIIFNV